MSTISIGFLCGSPRKRLRAWLSALFFSCLSPFFTQPIKLTKWIRCRRSVMDEPVTLSAQRLTKRFPQGDSDVEVLHGIDLDLREGEIVAIIGPSGAGKSTLLHLLGLMEQPSSGTL